MSKNANADQPTPPTCRLSANLNEKGAKKRICIELTHDPTHKVPYHFCPAPFTCPSQFGLPGFNVTILHHDSLRS